ncbi:MAG: permease-like cell division protein FtsX [Bdellovibrionota bacterium]
MYVLAFRLAAKNLLHRPFSRLLVVVSMGCILLINALVFLLFQTFSKSLVEVQDSRYITVYLDGAVESQREPEVVSAVKKVSGVSSAHLISKDAFLENFSRYFPQLSSELATLEADTIPRFIKVKVAAHREQSAQKDLQKIKGVELVESNKEKFSGLIGALATLRKFALVLIAGMSLALLCILLNHFKLRTEFQTQIRNTLSALGARGGQVLLPFAMEGFLEGLLGGGLAALILIAYGKVFESQLNSFFESIGYHPYHFELGGVALALLVIGMLSGMMGSVWATFRAKSN